jgi:hypothetical protein
VKRAIFILFVACSAVGFAFVGLVGGRPHARPEPAAISALAVSSPSAPAGDVGELLSLDTGTKRTLGEFELGGGRRVRLMTADTLDGKSCLLDDDSISGIGATCLERGLFTRRRVAFLVSFEGGPERFSELHVAGVAAPSIRGVSLLKTDGTVVELRLNAGRAFVFESPAADLEARTYPTALRLYGASGKLVETVTFPPAG